MTLGDEAGVLVVRDDERALEDGAAVEVRAGTVAEPGAPVAAGVLRDPLAGVEAGGGSGRRHKALRRGACPGSGTLAPSRGPTVRGGRHPSCDPVSFV
jgi:hypothetical protein